MKLNKINAGIAQFLLKNEIDIPFRHPTESEAERFSNLFQIIQDAAQSIEISRQDKAVFSTLKEGLKKISHEIPVEDKEMTRVFQKTLGVLDVAIKSIPI